MIPFVDKVVFDLEKEGVPLQAKFLQGYYDSPAIERLDYGTAMIVSMSDDKKKEKEYREKGVKLPTTIEANNWYIGFNWLDPVVGKGDTPDADGTQPQAAAGAVDRHRLGGARRDLRARARCGRAGAAAAVALRLSRGRALRVQSGRLHAGSRRQAGAPLASTRRRSCSPRRAIPMGAMPRPASRWCSTSTISRAPTPGVKALLDWYTKQFAKIGVQLEVRATDYNRFQDKMQQGLDPDLLLGLARRLPRRRELPVHAVRAELEGAHRRQRREQHELPESGVRQAVREDEIPRGRPGEAEAHRPDDRDVQKTRSGASATSRPRPRPTTSGSATASRRRSCATTSVTCGSIPSFARARSPNGTSPVWWPIPLIVLGIVARHRAGMVRLAAARARDRRAHARGRGRRAVIHYILRRIGYGVLILIGVNLFTFMLFFTVNTPDDMARMNIGGKRVTQDAIEKWKVERGYDKPLFWNAKEDGVRQAHEHDLRRALGAALRVRLRRVRQRARHRLRAEAPRRTVDRARRSRRSSSAFSS